MKKIKWEQITRTLGQSINTHYTEYTQPKLYSYLYRFNSINKYPTNLMVTMGTQYFAINLVNVPYCLFMSDIL